MKDQAGLVHTYSFDARGRQIADEVTSWGSSTVDQTIKQLTTGYDARGLVVSAKSFGTGPTLVNSVAFVHNGWRQLAEETQSHEGGTPRTIVYGYATGGANTIRRTSMTYPSGQSSAPVLNYIYTGTHANELSRVSAIRDGGTDIISYKWLGVGKPVDINYNVPATHLSYGTAADHYAGLDRFGRPISVPWLKDGSPALVHAQYRYDRISNRQWRRDAAAHAAGVATEDQWYEYDGLYQVGEFQRGTLSGSYPNFSGITPVAQNQDWNYDALGNWLGFQNNAVNQTRQFNKVNEITSINGPSGVVTPLYDPVGNMTTMPAVSNWTTAQALKWDAWNRLVKVSEASIMIAEYSYDALFRRVTKTASGNIRRFYYNDQWQILEEYLGSSANPHMRYWYGLRDMNDIARRQRYSSGTTLQDDLYALRETMNVVALVDSSGSVQHRMAYDAFGNTRFLTSAFAASSNAADWNLLFHGHYRDADTGLYQMRFRHYHPNLGVWLSRDPIGEEGGMNLISLVGSDPIQYIDFLGQDRFVHDIGGHPSVYVQVWNVDCTSYEWVQVGFAADYLSPRNVAIGVAFAASQKLPPPIRYYVKLAISGWFAGLVKFGPPTVDPEKHKSTNATYLRTTCEEDNEFLSLMYSLESDCPTYSILFYNCRHFCRQVFPYGTKYEIPPFVIDPGGVLSSLTPTTPRNPVVPLVEDVREMGPCRACCFCADTQIEMADGSKKLIQEVVKGDQVVSYSFPDLNINSATVIETHSPTKTELARIEIGEVINNNTLDHPYFVVGKGWASVRPEQTMSRYEAFRGVTVSELEVGDQCLRLTSRGIVQVAIRGMQIYEVNETAVYNFRVEGTGCYFANGILVHNK
jgi:RHS repeat-associated protein